MYDRSRFHGMDPDEAEQGSRGMQQGASQVSGMVSQITALLSEVTWVGSDAQGFMSDWDGTFRPEMNKASDCLQEHATELNRRAQMQRQASS